MQTNSFRSGVGVWVIVLSTVLFLKLVLTDCEDWGSSWLLMMRGGAGELALNGRSDTTQ